MSEAKVLRDCIAHLEKLKKRGERIWWVKIAGGPRQKRGLPDLHVTYNGRSFWFELKALGKNPTRLQEAMLRKIIASGAIVSIVRSVVDLRAILDWGQ